MMDITLYTTIGRDRDIAQVIADTFSQVLKKAELDSNGDNKRLLITFKDDTTMEFFINMEKSFIEEHLQSMINFYSQDTMEDKNLQEQILKQIAIFNCCIGCRFVPNDIEKRTNFIINSMFVVAQKLNGFLFMPDNCLYDGKGKMLISPAGKSEFTEYFPIANSDILDRDVEEKECDIERREKSIEKLKEKNIPFIPKLKSSIMEEEAILRKPDEIAKRLSALFGVCIFSEVMCSRHNIKDARKFYDMVDKIYHIKPYLSPEEKKYVESENPPEWVCIDKSWRYECCQVLLWALGYVDLPYPDKICDVEKIAKIMWTMDDIDELLKKSKPRRKKEILDEADLILRYDWACVEARIKKEEMPEGLNEGVVKERHYALNWLIGVNNRASWDNVTINT